MVVFIFTVQKLLELLKLFFPSELSRPGGDANVLDKISTSVLEGELVYFGQSLNCFLGELLHHGLELLIRIRFLK